MSAIRLGVAAGSVHGAWRAAGAPPSMPSRLPAGMASHHARMHHNTPACVNGALWLAAYRAAPPPAPQRAAADLWAAAAALAPDSTLATQLVRALCVEAAETASLSRRATLALAVGSISSAVGGLSLQVRARWRGLGAGRGGVGPLAGAWKLQPHARAAEARTARMLFMPGVDCHASQPSQLAYFTCHLQPNTHNHHALNRNYCPCLPRGV